MLSEQTGWKQKAAMEIHRLGNLHLSDVPESVEDVLAVLETEHSFADQVVDKLLSLVGLPWPYD